VHLTPHRRDASRVPQLLKATREGSEQPLGELLEQCRPYLLLIANSELDSDLCAKAGASDLVQESFLEAQRDIGRFQGTSIDELMGWLRQILLHNLADFARHYRETAARRLSQEKQLDGSEGVGLKQGLLASEPSPSKQAMANEQQLALARAVQRLPEEYRRALMLRHQEQYSFAQIGEALDRSAEAARKIWFRAVERLREELAAKGEP
jgi:RNA polymerase sigma-70 factor (ECF subfamily)